MYNIRQLASDELEAWDKLVSSSPQASLFHTSKWNQVISGVERQGGGWNPLICEQKGAILGGIPLQYAPTTNTQKNCLPALFGYNGPILSPQINYGTRDKTIVGYEVISELLEKMTGIADHIVVHNQPDIWDVRAYKYQNWKIETSYTHLWQCPPSDTAQPHTDASLQDQIESIKESSSLKTHLTKAEIQKFIARMVQSSHHPNIHSPDSAKTITNTIYALIEHDLCSLVTITDNNGVDLATSLLFPSEVNHSLYIWHTIYWNGSQETKIFPSLLWQIYLQFGQAYTSIDLSDATNQTSAQMKDCLGCRLIPRYTARYPK